MDDVKQRDACSIHEGACASFIQLLNLGFHSSSFDVTFGFLCHVLERKGRAISH